ncbi:CDP-glycerol glycerophosphotransferase family protein [Domibacillus indicus]|uniref:CDP-glycerol glycerophosphotransferase family protein n=1 Tax=Domibacillus indicus TaxID=1437523 RepID=UPI00203EC207|nr:CDP-glycerol glycerophosphotransferase family protein [Domibacillus indicus]MCM3789353.1 CDP-glycerol glycerophosphotransferase family protein [Domibacillus indicus]
MVRELAIFLFLFSFKWMFFFFSFLPLQNKITFVVSFGDNSRYVLDEIRQQHISVKVAVLCKRNKLHLFEDCPDIDLVVFETNPFYVLRSIYHLATSRRVLVDNYYGFLAAVHFKRSVECIQLWHASGALKKFGLQDASVKQRSERAQKRFLKVYSQFHKVVAGSDQMADIFIKSFHLQKKQILPSGVPRTDFFFDKKALQKAKHKIAGQYPAIEHKQVILYVPTYRDQALAHFELELDMGKMAEQLGGDYLLFLRLHPAIQQTPTFGEEYPDFIVDVSSDQYEINELLAVADYLITDYSSIPVEFSLLQKPMIFFTYDLEEYKQTRGVPEGFERDLPGPMVRDTESIVHCIQANHFDLEAIRSYAEKWNAYSKGQSSRNVVRYLFPEKSLSQKKTMR